jgi:predicted DNA-binding ribbon-helix-helix protein
MKSPEAFDRAQWSQESVSLEEPFWNGMKEISRQRGMTLSELVGAIDSARQQNNLSSAIRLFVLDHFKSLAVNVTDEPRPLNHAPGAAESPN